MADETASKVTLLLREVSAGRPGASDELFPLIYNELREIAHRRMNGERRGHTLQTTALVHEVYIRLFSGNPLKFTSQIQFYRTAALAMRRVLIDHARRKGRKIRGGDCGRVEVGAIDPACEHDCSLFLAVDEAIERLGERCPRTADVVRLRHYVGLSVEEVAKVLDCSVRTIEREWAYARACLYRDLNDADA